MSAASQMGRTTLDPLRGVKSLNKLMPGPPATKDAPMVELAPLVIHLLRARGNEVRWRTEAMTQMTVVMLQDQAPGADVGALLSGMVGGQMAWEPACLFAAANALEGDPAAWLSAIPAGQEWVLAFLEEREVTAQLANRGQEARVFALARQQLELARVPESESETVVAPSGREPYAPAEPEFACAECGAERSSYGEGAKCRRCRFGARISCACGATLNLGEIGPSAMEAEAKPHGWLRNLVTAEWFCSDCHGRLLVAPSPVRFNPEPADLSDLPGVVVR